MQRGLFLSTLLTVPTDFGVKFDLGLKFDLGVRIDLGVKIGFGVKNWLRVKIRRESKRPWSENRLGVKIGF